MSEAALESKNSTLPSPLGRLFRKQKTADQVEQYQPVVTSIPNKIAEDPLFDEPFFRPDDEGIFFTSSGIKIFIEKNDEEFTFELNEKNERITIPPGVILAVIDFLPFWEPFYIKGTKTVAIAKALKGLNDFLQFAGNDHKIPYPEYIFGGTNERMASFAKRFGFEEFSDPVEPEEDNKDSEPQIPLVVRTDILKERLEEYNRKYPAQSKLFARAVKENTKIS